MGNGGSNAIIITTAIFFGVSLVTVCLRCFVRLRIVKSFGADDALMIVAAVSMILLKKSAFEVLNHQTKMDAVF